MGALASQLHTGTAAHCSVGAAHCRRPSQMLLKLFAMFTLTTALVGPVSAASVEVSPFGEQDGRTIYAVALAGDIKSADDLRVASLLGKAAQFNVAQAWVDGKHGEIGREHCQEVD